MTYRMILPLIALFCGYLSAAENPLWLQAVLDRRTPLPPEKVATPQPAPAGTWLAADDFTAEAACLQAHLPFSVTPPDVWETLLSSDLETVRACTFTQEHGVTARFAVHTQLGNSVPLYWTGEGFPAVASADAAAASAFVSTKLCDASKSRTLAGFSRPLERSQVKILCRFAEETPPYERFWFIFADDRPGANWDHPCRYIYLAEDLSSFTVVYRVAPPAFRARESGEPIDFDDCPEEEPVSIQEIRNSITAELAAVQSSGISYAGDTSRSHFVLVSGGVSPQENLICFWAGTARFYSTLTRQYRVPKDQIHVYISDGTDPAADANLGNPTSSAQLVSSPVDLDGDGLCDVDGAATYANVKDVFTRMKNTLTSEDQLIVFFTSHGGTVGTSGPTNYDSAIALFSTTTSVFVRDYVLHDWTKNIPCPVAILIDCCHSGGFCDDIVQTPNRVIATASTHMESSWAVGGGGSWVNDDVGYTSAFSYWSTYIFTALRGYFSKTFPWTDGTAVDASALDRNDGKVSLLEGILFAKERSVRICKVTGCTGSSCTSRPMQHPQTRESTPGLVSTFFAVKSASCGNDNFEHAVTLTGNSGSYTGSNGGATREPDEPEHIISMATTSAWWKWTPETSVRATFTTEGSSFSAVLAIYTGETLASLETVAQADGAGSHARCTFTAEAGTTYFIALAGRGGETGSLKLSWSSEKIGPPDTPETPSVAATPEGLQVCWTPPDGAESCNLYRSTTPTRPEKAYQTDVESPFIDTAVELKTTYYYWISAVNSYGETFSSPVSGIRTGLPNLLFAPFGADKCGWSTPVFLNSAASATTPARTFDYGKYLLLFCVFANNGESNLTGRYTIRHEIIDENSAVVSSWEKALSVKLASGGCTWWNGTAWPDSNTISPGSYRYRCTLDVNNEIEEADETDNTWEYHFTIVSDAHPCLITTQTVGNGTVTGGGTYSAGSRVTLTATPAEGYQFSGWSGGVTSTDNPLVFTAKTALTVTATFTGSAELNVPEEIRENEALYAWLKQTVNQAGATVTLDDGITAQTLDAARLLGVEPHLRDEGDSIAVAAKAELTLSALALDEHAINFTATVRVEAGRFPETLSLAGIPAALVSNDLFGGTWTKLTPNVTLTRLSDTEAELRFTLDRSDYRFCKMIVE